MTVSEVHYVSHGLLPSLFKDLSKYVNMYVMMCIALFTKKMAQ